MSTGLILLIIVGILVGFGVAQRVLDRLRLTDRQALFFVLILLVGGLLPDIPLGDRLTVNVGGALVPLGLAAYLLIKADSTKEVVRSLVASVLTGASIYFLGRMLPDEPETAFMDFNYLYGIAAGVIAYLFGRSRRGAFVAGILGAVIADVWSAFDLWMQGVSQPLHLGGAGVMDVVVISGIVAVLLAEFVGELIERIWRGRERDETREFIDGEFVERSRQK
ncbi:MAG: DUF1614 domain-containing protein [Clostridia bacterium]|nr:DUF1614 domain-containing protein [Clostridia bacterium]